MQRDRFARTAWWHTAALLLFFPGLAAAGLKDRPARILCPPEEYLCPFGLAQWMAEQHRWVHGEQPAGETDTESAEAALHEAMEAPAPAPVVESPFTPDGGCPHYGCRDPQHDADAEEIDPAAEPTVEIDEPDAVGMREPAEISEDESLADILADPRHSMGQRYVLHLNRLQDGLDDELDAEIEWSDPFLPDCAIPPAETEAAEEINDEAGEEDVDHQSGCGEEANDDEGYFAARCARIGAAVVDAFTEVIDTLQRLADEAAASESADDPWAAPLPSQRLEPHDFIPAFGSPYDGQ